MSRQQKQRSHVDAILSVALIALATLAVNAGGDTVVLQVSNDDPDRRNHSIAARMFTQIQANATGDFRTGEADGRTALRLRHALTDDDGYLFLSYVRAAAADAR